MSLFVLKLGRQIILKAFLQNKGEGKY